MIMIEISRFLFSVFNSKLYQGGNDPRGFEQRSEQSFGRRVGKQLRKHS